MLKSLLLATSVIVNTEILYSYCLCFHLNAYPHPYKTQSILDRYF